MGSLAYTRHDDDDDDDDTLLFTAIPKRNNEKGGCVCRFLFDTDPEEMTIDDGLWWWIKTWEEKVEPSGNFRTFEKCFTEITVGFFAH